MNQEGKWVLKTTGTYCSLPKWPEPESRGLLYTFFTFFSQECHQETETLWVQASEKDEGKGRHFVLHPIRVELASPHWNEKRRELREKGQALHMFLTYVTNCFQKIDYGHKKDEIDFAIARRINRLFKILEHRFSADLKIWSSHIAFLIKIVSLAHFSFLQVSRERVRKW